MAASHCAGPATMAERSHRGEEGEGRFSLRPPGHDGGEKKVLPPARLRCVQAASHCARPGPLPAADAAGRRRARVAPASATEVVENDSVAKSRGWSKRLGGRKRFSGGNYYVFKMQFGGQNDPVAKTIRWSKRFGGRNRQAARSCSPPLAVPTAARGRQDSDGQDSEGQDSDGPPVRSRVPPLTRFRMFFDRQCGLLFLVFLFSTDGSLGPGRRGRRGGRRRRRGRDGWWRPWRRWWMGDCRL